MARFASLSLLLFSVVAHADNAAPLATEQAQHAMDLFKLRMQTNEQVAANLTPDERLLLLSGIICDAEDQAKDARNEIKKQRAIGRASSSVDSQLHDQETIVQEQQSRISQARRQLGRVKPIPCRTPRVDAVVCCIRARGGLVPPADTACRLPDFWKYQGALFNLDVQWRNLIFHGNATQSGTHQAN